MAYEHRCALKERYKERPSTFTYWHAVLLLAVGAWLVNEQSLDTTPERIALSVGTGLLSTLTAAMIAHYRKACRFNASIIVRLEKAARLWQKGEFLEDEALYDFVEGWGEKTPGGSYYAILQASVVVMSALLLFAIWLT